MLIVKNVTNECFDSVSFCIGGGVTVKIITRSDYDSQVLLNTILSIQRPVRGNVFLFGKDIYSLCKKEWEKTLRRVGVAWKSGGTISNLNVWDNITLPLWYHTGKKPADMMETVIDLFRHLGKDSSYVSEIMETYPGLLPRYERRFIGVIRSMLLKPELIIYDSIFDSLNDELKVKLSELTSAFQREIPNRSSLYVSSNEHSLSSVRVDIVIKQYGNQFCPT